MFFRNSLASGVVPQIAMVMGPCAGRGVFAPGLCDFVFMVKDKSTCSWSARTSSRRCRTRTSTFEELGGASVHSTKSGSAHFVAEDDLDCIKQVKKLMSYLPSNNLESASGQGQGRSRTAGRSPWTPSCQRTR